MSADPPELRFRSTTARGRVVEYAEEGAGPPVVLLHANGETARDWRWVVPALAREHRVVALGLPGLGGTAPTDDHRPGPLAEWLVGVLDALDLPTATLVGNSLGGLVALQAAVDHPDRVERLVLVDAAGLGRTISPALALETPPVLGEVAVRAASGVPGGAHGRAALRAALVFGRPWRAPRAWLTDQVEHGSRHSFVATTVAAHRAVIDLSGQRHVLLDRLPEVEAPTLVVWGTQDRVVPVVHGREAVRRLRHASLALVPGAGHLPQVESPAAVTAAVLPFLDQRGAQ